MTIVYTTDASVKRLEEKLPSRPFNHGKPWSEKELADMAEFFDAGAPLEHLCFMLGRTPIAVLAKLHSGGFIEPHGTHYRVIERNKPMNENNPYSPVAKSAGYAQPTRHAIVGVEQVTLINGERAESFSDDALVSMIATNEAEVDRLSAIKVSSKAITKMVEQRRKFIADLVAVLDARHV